MENISWPNISAKVVTIKSATFSAIAIRKSIMGAERKVAVITGASQGIGAALDKTYCDRNYREVATSRSITRVHRQNI